MADWPKAGRQHHYFVLQYRQCKLINLSMCVFYAQRVSHIWLIATILLQLNLRILQLINSLSIHTVRIFALAVANLCCSAGRKHIANSNNKTHVLTCMFGLCACARIGSTPVDCGQLLGKRCRAETFWRSRQKSTAAKSLLMRTATT